MLFEPQNGRAVFELVLHSFPTFPIMNNLYHHDGNPRATDFWCDTSSLRLASGAGGPVRCVFETLSDDARVKTYAECSNHGTCDRSTGVCACQDGFYGDACADNADSEDVLVAPARGPFFSGNVLHVSASRDMAASFNLIKADAAGATVFTLDGEGNAALLHGSLSVARGDVVLQRGKLEISRGGSLELDAARLRLVNSNIYHVYQLNADGNTNSDSEGSGEDPLLHLEMRLNALASSGTAAVSHSAPDFLRMSMPTGPILRVTGAGNTVIHDGGLEILRGGLRLERGGLQVLADGVRIRNGGLELRKDDLTLGAGSINVWNGQLTLRAPPSSSPMAALRVFQRVNDQQAATTARRLDASVGIPVFEVGDSGTTIHSGGLNVAAGGVEVVSGGVEIASGGLRVKSGGIQVDSGALTTNDGFAIENGGLQVKSQELNGAVLSVAATNSRFAGALVSFDVSAQRDSSGSPPFRLIDARDSSSSSSVLSIDSRGNVETSGDLTTTSGGKIMADGALVAAAQLVASPLVMRAANGLVIPSSHSYVRITNDGDSSGSPNAARIDVTGAFSGQLLLVQNDDDDAITGDISLFPGSTALLVFDGARWQMLSAGGGAAGGGVASSVASLLSNVGARTGSEATGESTGGEDAHVGGSEVKLTVHSLEVSGRDAGYVAVYGRSGKLDQHEGLRYDAATSTLRVEQLEARRLRGSIDMTQSELRGVEITGGHISHVNMTELDTVEVQGELFVESGAFFGAGITVDGHVMGSGAYVDASDARFKRDVIDIQNASELVGRLRGVEYSLRSDEFPEKNFPTNTRELGFIAQEVEQVLPQVVVRDSDGFNHVAYARLIPVVVEALKTEQQRVSTLAVETAQLRNEIAQLRAEMEKQRRITDELMARLGLVMEMDGEQITSEK
jgi:hypothetical protein